MNDHLTSEDLLRFVRDEMPAEENDTAAEHIEGCEQCESALEALATSAAAHIAPSERETAAEKSTEEFVTEQRNEKQTTPNGEVAMKPAVIEQPVSSGFAWRAFFLGLLLGIPLLFAIPLVLGVMYFTLAGRQVPAETAIAREHVPMTYEHTREAIPHLGDAPIAISPVGEGPKFPRLESSGMGMTESEMTESEMGPNAGMTADSARGGRASDYESGRGGMASDYQEGMGMRQSPILANNGGPTAKQIHSLLIEMIERQKTQQQLMESQIAMNRELLSLLKKQAAQAPTRIEVLPSDPTLSSEDATEIPESSGPAVSPRQLRGDAEEPSPVTKPTDPPPPKKVIEPKPPTDAVPADRGSTEGGSEARAATSPSEGATESPTLDLKSVDKPAAGNR